MKSNSIVHFFSKNLLSLVIYNFFCDLLRLSLLKEIEVTVTQLETELNGLDKFLCETEKKVNTDTEDLYQHKTSRAERIQAVQALIDENSVIILC